MYGIRYAGNPASIFEEDHNEGLCEAYEDGMIYEVYSSRQAAERAVVEMGNTAYSVVPLPSYAGPETEFCDRVYLRPSPLDNPDITEEEMNDYYAFREACEAVDQSPTTDNDSSFYSQSANVGVDVPEPSCIFIVIGSTQQHNGDTR